MKRLSKAIFILIIFLSQQSCSDSFEIDKMIDFKGDNFAIHCNIKELEYNTVNEKHYTYIKGKIEIANTNTDTIDFNLKNARLLIGSGEVGEIYINSIASVIISNEKLSPNEKIIKDVYWAFNRKIKTSEIEKIKIVYSKG